MAQGKGVARIMTYVFTAQAYGCGPASKAVAIAEAIRSRSSDSKLIFVGLGIALDYATTNRSVFDIVLDVNELDASKYSPFMVISVMEPDILATLSHMAYRSVYVDSLYTFWDWNASSLLQARQLLEDAMWRGKINWDLVQQRLKVLHPHAKQFVGHALCGQSYLQHFSAVPVPSFPEHRVSLVGPILSLGNTARLRTFDNVLISLCGLDGPGISECAVVDYGQLVIQAIWPSVLHSLSLGLNVHICTRIPFDYLKNSALKLSHPGLSYGFLAHADYMKRLVRSAVLLAPASLTSVLEAVAVGVPVVYLPEQNTSHWPNREQLSVFGFDGWSVIRNRPELYVMDEHGMNALHGIIHDMLSDKECVGRMQKYYDVAMAQYVFASQPHSHRFVDPSQRSDGAKMIVDDLLVSQGKFA